MPAFRRNILSPSSGLKWRCWEVGGIYIGSKDGKAVRKGANQETRTRGSMCGPIGSLNAGDRATVLARGRRERRSRPFSGPSVGGSCSWWDPVSVLSGQQASWYIFCVFMEQLLRCRLNSVARASFERGEDENDKWTGKPWHPNPYTPLQ
jgi:hypothetical protein